MDESKLIKYIEYYQNKVDTKKHCCDDGKWFDNYALKILKTENRMPRVYDSCFCITNFGIERK